MNIAARGNGDWCGDWREKGPRGAKFNLFTQVVDEEKHIDSSKWSTIVLKIKQQNQMVLLQ